VSGHADTESKLWRPCEEAAVKGALRALERFEAAGTKVLEQQRSERTCQHSGGGRRPGSGDDSGRSSQSFPFSYLLHQAA